VTSVLIVKFSPTAKLIFDNGKICGSVYKSGNRQETLVETGSGNRFDIGYPNVKITF